MAGGEKRRERKVVTVLFCDLVGFTSQAESMDPEDVEALLRPYHERVRGELERHGGTVEKFIGDAVMALFGAPTAHEDDPERAVRAALAISEFALEEELELRVGITTGEALVSLDANPASGEGMASGDVVNTAARLQSAAPVNGILVDETTCRATRSVIDYESAEPVEAKGKSAPIDVWTAVAAHSRFGVDTAHEARSELVGRERELGLVRDTFERARHERTPQLLTLVGVPGIGKSRLVYELQRIVDADPELITWRQGRCLAYGDGITMWALGEIVKAQAGILEQDSQGEAAAKVRRAIEDVLAGTGDESWVEGQLLALVGLGSETELGDDRRATAFAAWRRFLEALAEQRPLVLVFEDLHWADESLLDFVDELVDWVSDTPLLVVATARPELLERRPAWGGGKLNATTIALTPLSDEQTAQLVSHLLDRPVLEASSQRALLERAGGNPLYAEQYVELFRERGQAEGLPLPETLQGLIAARLDELSTEEKTLLQEASVVGKVFWTSALASDARDVPAVLHTLERKGFVRRQKRSSVEGESELAFAHALVRDVAYGQIARADRADRHRRVAEWIESLGRHDDHAEMLAHHWRTALELARAAGQEDAGADERARRALTHAGERAYALNSFAASARYFADALELCPPDDPERPDLLFHLARALHVGADERRTEALAAARDALLATDDVDRAAECEALLAQGAWYRGRRQDVEAHIERALELVGSRPSSASKARVLAYSARFRSLAGDEDATATAEEAMAIAEELDLHEVRVHALTTVGTCVAGAKPDESRRVLGRALEIARAADSPLAPNILNNLGVVSWWAGDLPQAESLYAEAALGGERLGDRDMARFGLGNLIATRTFLGRWDAALGDADDFITGSRSSPHYLEHLVRESRALIRLARGDVTGALEDLERALEQARAAGDPQALVTGLLHSARAHGLLGNSAEARRVADEYLSLTESTPAIAAGLTLLLPVAATLRLEDRILELARRAPETPWRNAAIAGASGDLVEAAQIYERIGSRPVGADMRLAAAEELAGDGRHEEAEAVLEQALAFWRDVRATFFLERAEAVREARPQSESA